MQLVNMSLSQRKSKMRGLLLLSIGYQSVVAFVPLVSPALLSATHQPLRQLTTAAEITFRDDRGGGGGGGSYDRGGGGGGGGRSPDWNEKRVDPSDGNAYTKSEFRDFYPSFAEWDAAEPQGGGRGRRPSFGGGDGFHDYSRAPDDDGAPVDTAAVDAILSERVACKKSRNFEQADALREQLEVEHGITVWDKERTWRTGSGGGRSSRQTQSFDRQARVGQGGSQGYGQDQQGGGQRRGYEGNNAVERAGGGRGRVDFGAKGHDYERTGGAFESGLDEAEVDAMLATRMQFKFKRDFVSADKIQEELFAQGVRVHDKSKQWRGDGVGFGDAEPNQRGRGEKVHRPYEKAGSSDPSVSSADEQAIADLVQARGDAKGDRDFDAADAIRAQLMAEFSCFVDDRSRLWSVGPTQDCFGADAFDDTGLGDRNRAHVRRGGGDLSPADLQKVQGMLDARSAAKADRDFEAADQIRDALKEEFAVSVDDRSREWRVQTEAYARSQATRSNSGTELSEEDVAKINLLILERTAFKMERDYEQADKIRDALRDEFSVTLDDRVREWAVTSDETGSLSAQYSDGSRQEDFPASQAFQDDFEEAASPLAVPPGGSGGDLAALTVPELKEMCRAEGLKVGGKKSELVDRLLQHKAP